MQRKISVIGAGGWGTTIAALLGWKGYKIKLWAREEDVSKEINEKKSNTKYIPKLKIPDSVVASSSLEDVTKDADIIITVIPSQFVREVAKELSKFVKKNAIVVSATKGIEGGSYKTMSQVIEEEIKDISVAALSGPNHAEEVAMKIPTATVIASENADCLPVLKEIFTTDYFKVYTLEDITGVQICGALKNITAIATGVCDGLGFGDNARGGIITLGLKEMNNFGRHFGAKQATCYGLAGIGDLIATCTSRHSRNRFVGETIAKGKSLEEIKKEMRGMIAEGVITTKAIYEFSKNNNINMPLTTQVYKVLYEKKNLKSAIADLIKLI